jgi:Signal transduction histidine kinase
MKSIKTRLVGNFMLVILITVVILEISLISAVKRYYYNNVEEMLTNQVKFSSQYYSRYFSSSSLEDNIIDNVDVFWQQTSAEVQIIDLSGRVLMDSIGVSPKAAVQTADFKKALQGQSGRWIGSVDYSKGSVMAVSYPLISGGMTTGVLRFITSMDETDKSVRIISIIFIWIGLLVVLISGLVSVFLSNSIIKPLKEVTNTAEKMASGRLSERCSKKYDDEIGKLSDTLNYMAREIENKEQLKNEFISSVSHELRTPLTSIKGWAITLNSGNFSSDPTLKGGLDIIEKESDRLTHMVEELLDFSRFVSGKITLQKSKVDIEALMKQIERQLSPRANVENIRFALICEDGLPHIIGDENRLKQVFINILDNGFKFSPKNSEIVFSAARSGNLLKIIVKDNGCGIPGEDLPHVKEKFYKGKSSKSKTGLGLSICDEIVKLHGGKLEITSELGKGTEVVVLLPIDSGRDAQ